MGQPTVSLTILIKSLSSFAFTKGIQNEWKSCFLSTFFKLNLSNEEVKARHFRIINSETKVVEWPNQWKHSFFRCYELGPVVGSEYEHSLAFRRASLPKSTLGNAETRGQRPWFRLLTQVSGRPHVLRVVDRVAYFCDVSVNRPTLNAVAILMQVHLLPYASGSHFCLPQESFQG